MRNRVDIDGLESTAGAEHEVRIERGFRDADLGAGGAEFLLGGAHVRAAVENGGGESGADDGQRAVRLAAGDAEIRRGGGTEHGERVFRGAALALDDAEVVFGEVHFGLGAAGGEAVG